MTVELLKEDKLPEQKAETGCAMLLVHWLLPAQLVNSAPLTGDGIQWQFWKPHSPSSCARNSGHHGCAVHKRRHILGLR